MYLVVTNGPLQYARRVEENRYEWTEIRDQATEFTTYEEAEAVICQFGFGTIVGMTAEASDKTTAIAAA